MLFRASSPRALQQAECHNDNGQAWLNGEWWRVVRVVFLAGHLQCYQSVEGRKCKSCRR